MKKGIAILGSTGSIGTQALDVIDHHPDRFRVVALAAGRQVERLAEQALRYRPSVLSVADAGAAEALSSRLQAEAGSYRPEIVWGRDGLIRAAAHPEASLVRTAVVGALGAEPTPAAIEAGKDIALAKQETLVAAGELVTAAARARGVKLIPVDSEHSAIFQSLSGADPRWVRRILLTASGGPFRGRKDLTGVTREE